MYIIGCNSTEAICLSCLLLGLDNAVDPTPLHGLQQEKPYRAGGRAGFIDQPPISVAIIFTALVADGATGRWRRVKQAHAAPLQEQMEREEAAS